MKKLCLVFLLMLYGCERDAQAPAHTLTHAHVPAPAHEAFIPEIKTIKFIFQDDKVTEKPEQAELPKNAYTHIPELARVIKELEYPIYLPQFVAGLIEQESCITLRHSRCWSPTAELKTSREYGFGLGQITVAYNTDGSERFNIFKELKAQKGFEDWDWNDRFNPKYQIRGIIVKLRSTDSFLKFEKADEYEAIAFLLSAYNGGAGHVLKDRQICLRKEGCDPSRWFGHVELDSVKSKTPQPAYGNQSFFQINRKYAPRVLGERMHKYTWYMESFLTEE